MNSRWNWSTGERRLVFDVSCPELSRLKSSVLLLIFRRGDEWLTYWKLRILKLAILPLLQLGVVYVYSIPWHSTIRLRNVDKLQVNYSDYVASPRQFVSQETIILNILVGPVFLFVSFISSYFTCLRYCIFFIPYFLKLFTGISVNKSCLPVWQRLFSVRRDSPGVEILT